MKVTLNLSIAASRRERYALVWAMPATLVGLAGLLLLLVATVHKVREYRVVRGSVVEYEEWENRLRERESALRKELERPQFRKVFRDAQFLNTLIEKKRVSVTALAAKVTKLLPGQVRLTGLALASQGDDLVVRFAVTGRNEEVVETFLSNLEDSSDFKDVAIINQGFQEEGGASGPVTIVCTTRYLAGAR